MGEQNTYRLRADIIDRINADADLSAGVTKALGIRPGSLPMTMQRNTRRLTEFPVLNFLSGALDIEINDLVEPAKIPAETE